MQTSTKGSQPNLVLVVILIVAVILRFYNLGGESFWLDELHTAKEAGPSLTIAQVLDFLGNMDQHPPLFFLMEHYLFSVFGFDEFGARVLPAIAGVVSVWVLYVFGKELLNKRMGTIAALICCVNIYNITYSQEARGYMFLWLFTSLSYLFLIRLYKYLRVKDVIFLALSTAALLYSHYFSILVVFCQLVLGIIFWVCDKENRKKFFFYFLVAEVIALTLYAPWLPYLFKMKDIHSFWIGKTSPLFFAEYFYDYFANVTPIAACLVFYFVYVVRKSFSFNNLRTNPASLSAIFIFVSIFLSWLIPYLRSVLVVPMLVSRYTIIVIPSFILCISYALTLIEKDRVRNILLTLIVLMSIADIFFIKKTYGKHKEQFREMVQYIMEDGKAYAVVNQYTGWHSTYYFDRYGYKGKILEITKDDWTNGLVNNTYQPDTFWMAGAHKDPKPDEAQRRKLNAGYVLVKEKDFKDAWAQLYARKPATF